MGGGLLAKRAENLSASNIGCISSFGFADLVSKTVLRCTKVQTIERKAIKFYAKFSQRLYQWIYQASLRRLWPIVFSKWVKMFKDGQEGIRQYRLLTVISHIDENVTRARDLLNYDSRISVRMIADTHNLQITTRHTIPTSDLNMRKLCAKLFSKMYGRAEDQSCNHCDSDELHIPVPIK